MELKAGHQYTDEASSWAIEFLGIQNRTTMSGIEIDPNQNQVLHMITSHHGNTMQSPKRPMFLRPRFCIS
jgi:hypothetical protein